MCAALACSPWLPAIQLSVSLSKDPMQAFCVEDSNLPVASDFEQGITRLCDTVPYESRTEAATIHAVSKAYYPSLFASNVSAYSSNLSVGSSNALFPVAAYSSNTVVWTSNTLKSVALQAEARLAAGTAAGVTATSATAAAVEA